MQIVNSYNVSIILRFLCFSLTGFNMKTLGTLALSFSQRRLSVKYVMQLLNQFFKNNILIYTPQFCKFAVMRKWWNW